VEDQKKEKVNETKEGHTIGTTIDTLRMKKRSKSNNMIYIVNKFLG